MKTYLYKLNIKNRTLENVFSSHTLFGAFCSAYLKLYGNLDFLDSFVSLEKMPFILSSSFPYYEDILFFPKPITEITEDIPITNIKKIKKIKFLSESLFRDFLEGKRNVIHFFKTQDIVKIQESFLMKKEEADENLYDEQMQIIKSDLIIRNAHPLSSNPDDKNRFEQSYFYFHPKAGLFFLARIEDNFKTQFDAVMRFLSHEGIGGQKSIGIGHFDLEEIREINFDIDNSNRSVLLSSMLPRDEEIQFIKENKNVFYDLETKRLKSSIVDNKFLWKPKLTFFKEGSILPFSEKPFLGTNLKLKSEFNIIQYGLGFVVGAV